MRFKTKELVLQALIATTYIVITFIFQAVSFMPQQFRVSEFLLILVLIHPKNSIGLILGTLVANTMSSVGAIDILVGTYATYVSLLLMVRLVHRIPRYLAPALVNGVIVGVMLTIVLEFPLWISMTSVFVSEVMVTFVPWIIVGDRIIKNDYLRRIFG